MIILLAPSKNMQATNSLFPYNYSIPECLDDAKIIIETLKKLNTSELSILLKTNSKLTQLNLDRIYQWSTPFTTDNSYPAALAYDGEVYRGLNAQSFSKEDWEFANTNLRILSGLYGILKPADIIQPYRLEVGTKLANVRGNDLYLFWKKVINKKIAELASDRPILNLASSEYSKMLDQKTWKKQFISPEFFEEGPNGHRKVIIYTKRARGLMARFVIQNNIENPTDLQAFNDEGYWYHTGMSTFNKPVFIR